MPFWKRKSAEERRAEADRRFEEHFGPVVHDIAKDLVAAERVEEARRAGKSTSFVEERRQVEENLRRD
jgi:hypothetical protein